MNTLWLLALVGLLPAFALAVVSTARGALGARLVALQLAGAVATFMIVIGALAFGQPSSLDLALTLAMLGLPGTFLLAVFAERWL